MTGQEIVQALRCCADNSCSAKCPAFPAGLDCREEMHKEALALLERLTAENAALREKVPQWISVEADRLRELAEADKDGRVVVLPCKVGDTVWRIVRDGEPHITRDEVCNMSFADDMTLCVELVGGRVTFTEKFGKTVFLTREEAERAMEGRKEADHA